MLPASLVESASGIWTSSSFPSEKKGNESTYKPDPVATVLVETETAAGDHPSGIAIADDLVRSTSEH